MKGNQHPRIKIETYGTGSDGPGACKLMQACGIDLYPWQQDVLNAWLKTNDAGSYTATTAAISISRQNGKSELILARILYGTIINGEEVLFTAHQSRTAKKFFQRMVNILTDPARPEISQTVKRIYYGTGEERITFNNGASVEFTSRTRQAARGYAGLSLVVFDEAADLTDEQAEAILSTLSSSSTGQRQQIYAGTPPYIGAPGEVFRRIRDLALTTAADENAKPRIAWHEWGIATDKPEEVDINDRALWYEHNPSMGYLLSEEFTETEALSLSKSGFLRERLGFWAAPATTQDVLAIDPATWESCKSTEQRPEGKIAYGVKFTPDGAEVVLAGAVIPQRKTAGHSRIGTDRTGAWTAGEISNDIETPARITLIAIEPAGRGLSWLADWLNERYNTASCVVIDGKNGADVLIDKIAPVWKLKDSIIKPNAQNVITAANMLLNDLVEHNLTWYAEQEDLNESALTATKRPISGGYGFGGQTSGPIEACSLALWGCKTSKRNPQRKMLIG